MNSILNFIILVLCMVTLAFSASYIWTAFEQRPSNHPEYFFYGLILAFISLWSIKKVFEHD